MRVKIQASAGEASLCYTCRHATLVKGSSQKHEIIDCRRLSDSQNRITFAVVSCTGYSDRRLPSLVDLEDIAWVLRSDPKRNTIGFVRSGAVKVRERIDLDEDRVPSGTSEPLAPGLKSRPTHKKRAGCPPAVAYGEGGAGPRVQTKGRLEPALTSFPKCRD